MMLCGTARAEDPIQMLDQVTKRVLAELKANRAQLKNSRAKLYSLVDYLIIPHVDFAEMARWVVGRNAWQKADAATQQAFVQEFKTLVVRTYATALLGYTNQTIEFLPLRGSSDKQRVQVFSLIKEGGKVLHLDYRLIREASGWRVYDIIIEGVSLMQGYRAQFADDIQRGGLQAAIEKMRQHNKGS